MERPLTQNLQDWLPSRLMALCVQDSTSGREDTGLAELRSLQEELGAEIVEQPVAEGRTNVLALWGTPRIVFSTHLDTVPPYFPPRLEGDVISGRGSCDAKGQVIAQLGAIRQLLSEGLRDVAWLGVVGEETDSCGATSALQLADHFKDCRALIVGEPTGLKLATGQRGVQHFVLRCTGKAAHSSTPEESSSAILLLLDWIQALRQIDLPVDAELGPEIWNLGLLSGGEAANAVPASAEAHLHARVLPGSHLEQRIRDLMPSCGSVERLLSDPPARYPRLPGFEHAATPFGSDAPQMRALVPDGTVVLAGPGTIRVAHGPDEQLSLSELEAGVDLNRRLALHFLQRP